MAQPQTNYASSLIQALRSPVAPGVASGVSLLENPVVPSAPMNMFVPSGPARNYLNNPAVLSMQTTSQPFVNQSPSSQTSVSSGGTGGVDVPIRGINDEIQPIDLFKNQNAANPKTGLLDPRAFEKDIIEVTQQEEDQRLKEAEIADQQNVEDIELARQLEDITEADELDRMSEAEARETQNLADIEAGMNEDAAVLDQMIFNDDLQLDKFGRPIVSNEGMIDPDDLFRLMYLN